MDFSVCEWSPALLTAVSVSWISDYVEAPGPFSVGGRQELLSGLMVDGHPQPGSVSLQEYPVPSVLLLLASSFEVSGPRHFFGKPHDLRFPTQPEVCPVPGFLSLISGLLSPLAPLPTITLSPLGCRIGEPPAAEVPPVGEKRSKA